MVWCVRCMVGLVYGVYGVWWVWCMVCTVYGGYGVNARAEVLHLPLKMS
jgi:hypothetical protein